MLQETTGREGGGIACNSKKKLNVKKIKPVNKCELWSHYELNTKKVIFVTIYLPKLSAQNRYNVGTFFHESDEVISHYKLYSTE